MQNQNKEWKKITKYERKLELIISYNMKCNYPKHTSRINTNRSESEYRQQDA